MRFSIIIPAYNSAKYITNALDGVTKQTFKDYELIVICDSCVDETQTIADAYGAKTVKVNYHNDGLSRSHGLDIAQGEYILFIDDDDWWIEEDMLEFLDKKIEEDNYPDILCFGFHFKGIGDVSTRRKCLHDLWPATWNKCWKRETIGDTRFPNVFSVSDGFFHDNMMKKNPRIVEYDKCFYYYNYLRPGSISAQQGNTIEATRQWI